MNVESPKCHVRTPRCGALVKQRSIEALDLSAPPAAVEVCTTDMLQQHRVRLDAPATPWLDQSVDYNVEAR